LIFVVLLSRYPPNVVLANAPTFVIPAKAGIQLLCSWLLVRFAKPASRPCALRRASLRAGHFLLLAQEKVTKEKGTPGTAVAGSSRRLREDAAAVR